MASAVGEAVEGPPFELEALTIEIPASAAPELEFCALPRDQYVDQVRGICLSPPRASLPGDEPTTVQVSLRGRRLHASADGWIGDDEDAMPLADALDTWWPLLGWDIFGEIREEFMRAASHAGPDPQVNQAVGSLLAIVDASERALAGRIATFLLSFEVNMVERLEAALEQAQVEAENTRARYLAAVPDPVNGRTDLEDLHDHIKALIAARGALLAFEAKFANVILFGRTAQQILLPHKLTTLLPLPPGGRLGADILGPLGAALEQWWKQEIDDYQTGRDRLLRAAAAVYAQARAHHAVLPHVWSELEADPGREELGRRIGAVCDDVAAASRKALEAVRDGQSYRLLHQRVKIDEVVDLESIWTSTAGRIDIPVTERRSGSVAELLNLEARPRPEVALGELMAERGTVFSRDANPLAGAANAVTVWDLDALRSTTMAAMGGKLGPIERAALNAVDWEAFKESLVVAGQDLGIRRVLDFALGPTGLGVIADALLGVVDLVHDLAEHSAQALLAKSELLATSPEARRILTRDPSLVPVFLDIVGSAGDIFAIVRLKRIAKLLRDLQLGFFLATAGPEFTELVTKIVIAFLRHEDEEQREERGR